MTELPLALLAAPSLVQRLTDNSFAGIHQLAWFDWAMLVPYFTVLVVLSVYGLHRYDVIRTYFKHQKNATKEPAKRFETLPPVTIQLPLYNERYVTERLIEECLKIEYPRELLQIQVLDDSTDDTAGILRKSMIEDAGGWQHDTLTEDSDLSYRAQLKGWRFVYLPGLDCPSELPVEMHGFQIQQSRWAKGLTQVAKKLLPAILKADIPKRVKFEAVMHLTPNISYPLMVLLSALMLPLMIVRFYMSVSQMFYLDMPLIIASFWSLSAFYVIAQRELYPKNWKRSIFLLP